MYKPLRAGLTALILSLFTVACSESAAGTPTPAPHEVPPSTTTAQDEPAPPAGDDAWRKPIPLDGLYARIAEDLTSGKPLVITAYYGMWERFPTEPDRNLNWGGKFGHATMLSGRTLRGEVRSSFQHTRWKRVLSEEAGSDPLRTLVFHQKVKPNKRWRARGVKAAFDVYLVMEAHADQESAAKRMTRSLRQGEGRTLTLDDGETLDTGGAQVVGYFGHNFFYDYEGFSWGGLDAIEGSPARPTGLFAVGCKTGRVPGFGRLIGENVHAVLFSRNLMASEGYSTFALTDGLMRHMSSKQIADLANTTYQRFQRLPNPTRRVGRPFISHDHGLYPAQ